MPPLRAAVAAAQRVPKPRKGVQQWVLSGISELAPLEPGWRKGGRAAQALILQEQRDLRRLRSQARREGRDPLLVSLPPRQEEPRRLGAREHQLLLDVGRIGPSRVDLMPPPRLMDASALSRAASTAAREQQVSGLESSAPAGIWPAICARARELVPSLDPQDLALLVKGMAKARYHDDELTAQLLQQAIARLAYFDARHLAILLAGLAKTSMEAESLKPVLEELCLRAPELQGAPELSMAIVAVSRLRAGDLVSGLVAQVEARLSADRFHARDLAAISGAYSRLQYLDARHMAHIAACARFTIREATPRDLAQLVSLTSRTGPAGAEQLIAEAAELTLEKVPFMLPFELTASASAFGQSALFLLGAEGESRAPLGDEAQSLQASVASAELLRAIAQTAAEAKLEPGQSAVILEGCARWHLPLPPTQLNALAAAAAAPGQSLASTTRALRAMARLLPDAGSDTGKAMMPHSMAVQCRPWNTEEAERDESTDPAWRHAQCLDVELRQHLAHCESWHGVTKAAEASFLFNGMCRPGLQSQEPQDSETPKLSEALRMTKQRLGGAADLSYLAERLKSLGGKEDDPVVVALREQQ
eukprot:TRINITY_DN60902_c0_g1_i1.p1 TRINITY_DN60902_c0_g1~~TRINITY_DN60902_c0_g1_i1.p1  ORF type:complete len:591 (-),score=120.13 TRINITY_DN60902_c0_g1_i1:36-1808(-)